MTSLNPSSREEKSHPAAAANSPTLNPSSLPTAALSPPNDPFTVSFSPNDPSNPQHWPPSLKLLLLLNLSLGALITTLAASILSPALSQILTHFGSSDRTLGVFSISSYMLGTAISPLVVSGLSEVYGRKRIFDIFNLGFVAFNVGCALAPSLGALAVLRCLSGFAGAVPATIGGGMIADLYPPVERGRATSVYGLGLIFGPVVAPIIGGPLAQAAGWRWVLWFMAILGGIYTVLTFFLFRETHAPTILDRKAAALRKSTGDERYTSKMARKTKNSKVLALALTRPLRMLLLSPVVLLTCAVLALDIGYLYLLLTTMATIFQIQYGFDETVSGLVYLGIGLGFLIGLVVFSRISDRMVKSAGEKGVKAPEVRLKPMVLGGLLACIGLIWYGWTIHYRVHWIVPIIGTIPFGISVTCFMMPLTTYFIDVWRQHAASAIGANVFFRSIWGAVIPLIAFDLYRSELGLGWGNTMLGLLSLITVPVPLLLMRYGPKLRDAFPVDL